MKLHLTPCDLFRLSAARDTDGLLPSVHSYNLQIRQQSLIGQPIVPVGTKNSLTQELSPTSQDDNTAQS